jgi:hypothetical protein
MGKAVKNLPVVPGEINDEALDRILERVDAKFIPATLDRYALLEDLCHVGDLWRDAVQARRCRPPLARRRELLKQARGHASKLLALLDDEAWPDQGVDFYADLRATLRGLLVIAEDLPKPNGPIGPGIIQLPWGFLLLGCSPFQWLAGSGLKRVFDRYFPDARERRYTRSAEGETRGPYISFAHQFLIEAKVVTADGYPYQTSSIADALRTCQKLGG